MCLSSVANETGQLSKVPVFSFVNYLGALAEYCLRGARGEVLRLPAGFPQLWDLRCPAHRTAMNAAQHDRKLS